MCWQSFRPLRRTFRRLTTRSPAPSISEVFARDRLAGIGTVCSTVFPHPPDLESPRSRKVVDECRFHESLVDQRTHFQHLPATHHTRNLRLPRPPQSPSTATPTCRRSLLSTPLGLQSLLPRSGVSEPTTGSGVRQIFAKRNEVDRNLLHWCYERSIHTWLPVSLDRSLASNFVIRERPRLRMIDSP